MQRPTKIAIVNNIHEDDDDDGNSRNISDAHKSAIVSLN